LAKKLKAIVRLQIQAGKANPAPPIGPALAGHGINLMAFCKEYNARTQNRMGEIIPAEISIFSDGSFTFILKTPPASVLLKKAAGVDKGSAVPNREKVGKVTRAQIRDARSQVPLLDFDPGEELATLKARLVEANELFKSAIDSLKAHEREVIDYYAGDLANMACLLVNCWLLLRDAPLAERKRDLAHVYYGEHLPEIHRLSEAIQAADITPLRLGESVLGS